MSFNTLLAAHVYVCGQGELLKRGVWIQYPHEGEVDAKHTERERCPGTELSRFAMWVHTPHFSPQQRCADEHQKRRKSEVIDRRHVHSPYGANFLRQSCAEPHI